MKHDLEQHPGRVETIVEPENEGQEREVVAPRRSSGQILLWFSVLFLVFLVLGAYSFVQKRTAGRELADQTVRLAVPHVAVIHATAVKSDSGLILPGNIQSYIQSPIYARTNGYLQKWYKDIGAHVKQGDLLAVIDAPEVDQQLAQAKADLATAEANVKLAQVTSPAVSGPAQKRRRFPTGGGQLHQRFRC